MRQLFFFSGLTEKRRDSMIGHWRINFLFHTSKLLISHVRKFLMHLLEADFNFVWTGYCKLILLGLMLIFCLNLTSMSEKLCKIAHCTTTPINFNSNAFYTMLYDSMAWGGVNQCRPTFLLYTVLWWCLFVTMVTHVGANFIVGWWRTWVEDLSCSGLSEWRSGKIDVRN
jgi:hypothetical protein